MQTTISDLQPSSIPFQCQVEAVALFACLTPRDMPSYMKMVLSGLFFTFLFCNVLGVIAYMTLGNMVAGDLLNSYQVDVWVMIGNMMVAIKAIVTYPQFILLSR